MASSAAASRKRPKESVERALQAAEAPRASWLRSTFSQSMASCVLLWAALPPLQLGFLAWLAPIPWVRLIERPALEGKRPYLALWLSGFLFWLAAVYWLTLPHWATAFGWLALSFYLAFYTPLFVGLSRIAVHQWRVSPVVAAPVVWTGLELARAHVLGGFLMAALGHTQYRWLSLIQVNDLAGAYAVSFVVMLVAACLARCLPNGDRKASYWPLAPALAAVALVIGYGQFRLAEETTRPGPQVALIQGNIETKIKADPNQNQKVFEEYFERSAEAIREHRNLDLIVWPETMFRTPWFTFTPDFKPPADAGWTPKELEARSSGDIKSTVGILQTPMLLGVESLYYSNDEILRYNSAVIADRTGKVTGRYDKMHLVMFGEYVPFATYFPWLYRLTPLHGGLTSGDRPQSFAAGVTNYAPNICYESTIPQLIRNQVSVLRERKQEPDVLVNLTNDGWFHGSSELNMHLICGVFRAVECRKPLLIAANTGISAWIDSEGQIQKQGRRLNSEFIIADTRIDSRRSPYLVVGDWPAGLCLLMCVALAAYGIWQRMARKYRLAPALVS